MIINGTGTLSGAEIHTYGDHRIAMSFAVAGMAAYGVTSLDYSECAVISYPGFYAELNKLC
jgi:3-phosphoshikimate 1-carboxyvinyltransferase